MAHQQIVTSAKQGLEGGTGDQAVLRSAGMPTQVASRLKAAGGYSHPFPQGDRRNPVVYVHRIEEAAGKTWHVLGCIRDVGSDHTGRSNFLAHMLAADQAEVRGKKAGPAAVMLQTGLFRDSWSGPPDGAAPAKTLVAGEEKPQPGSCPAWTAAGLDPGLAGDLAANATAGKPVVLVTRPGDDVLALFRDALRLVQPERRWSVTFNTCAIESFNGIWTAIRADLPQARSLRDSRSAVVIDLTKAPRGSDDPYARFARGDAESLPWQPVSKATAAAVVDTVVEAGPAAGSGKPPVLRPGIGAGGTVRRRWGGDHDSSPIFIPPPVTESKASGWVKVLGGVAVALLFVAGVTAYVLRDELVRLVWSKPAAVDGPNPDTIPEMPAGPTPEQIAQEQAEKKRAIDAARTKLAEAGGNRTDEIRAEAKKLEQEIDTLRKGSDTEPGLRIRPDGGNDPRDAAQQAIAAADRADEVRRLSDDAPTLLADLDEAARDLAAAVAKLDDAKQQVPDLETAERRARTDRMNQDRANARDQRQRDAFAAFAKEASLVRELPARGAADVSGIGGGGSIRGRGAEVDLGPFPVQDLVEPTLRLAVPDETINGTAFEALIEPLADKRWEIRWQTKIGLERKPTAVPFATLEVVDGLLRLKVEAASMETPPVAILRRCVILAEAKDPATKQPRVRKILLVQPKKVGLMQMDAAAGRQEMDIPVPVGIGRHDTPRGSSTSADLALPVSGIEITVQWGKEKETKRLPQDAAAQDQPGIVTWPGIRLSELGNGVALDMEIQLSLLGAKLTATPSLTGPASKGSDLAQLAEFEKDVESRPDVKAKFYTRVKNCPGRDYAKAHGSKTDRDTVESWFTKTHLATATKQGMKLLFPGHGTVAESMDLFFREKYAEEKARLDKDYQRRLAEAKDEEKKKIKPEEPKVPQGFLDWYQRCGIATAESWKGVFEVPLDDWKDWFWAQFEDHWEQQAAIAKAVHGQDVEVRLLEIVSVARDADGKEYRVPLVEFDAAAPATGGRAAPGAKRAGTAEADEPNERSRGSGL